MYVCVSLQTIYAESNVTSADIHVSYVFFTKIDYYKILTVSYQISSEN